MSRYLASILVIAAGMAPHPAIAGDGPRVIETRQVMVGDKTFVKLTGNPDLGYKWRLNKSKSAGLDHVKVDVIGWLKVGKDTSMFADNRSRLNVLLTGKAAGRSEIAFDYYRMFRGREVSRTSVVQVTVMPKPSTR